ncbi:uncharacterized protein LOC111823952 [Myotis lucifugus]|uniref:uncharacterized protein LOC111823952 n=1 Tax=Myotis lucifugus TaxID=59463 RepID=UPI000CCBD90E|nr:uncharacterized protein LOC111823952 [Myotis lucifugus]
MNWVPQLPRAVVGKSIPKKGQRGGGEEDGAQAQGPLSPDSHRPPRFQTRCGGGRGANWRRKSRTHALPAHTQEGRPRAEVTAAPRAQANRKCPFCSAETLTPIPPRQPPSEAPRASAGGGARGCRGRPPPHPGPEPGHPNAPAPNRPKFTPGCAFRDATWPGSAGVRPGPGEDSAPRTSGSQTSQGRGVAKTPGGLGAATSLHSGFSPVEPSASSGSPPALPERRHPSPQFPPRDTRSRAANTFQEKLRTPPGAALPSVRRPGEPTHHPSGALGRSPSRSQILRTKMSGRVTGQPPPGPTPGAGRTRCLCPGAAPRPRAGSADAGRSGRRSTWDSPSARPPRRGGKGREGEDTIWQSTAAAPGSFQQPPPGRRGHEQAAAAAVPAAAVPHPPLPLASSLSPRPSPRCHGNVAPRRLAPPLPPSVPASRSLSGGALGPPLPVPAHLS